MRGRGAISTHDIQEIFSNVENTLREHGRLKYTDDEEVNQQPSQEPIGSAIGVAGAYVVRRLAILTIKLMLKLADRVLKEYQKNTNQSISALVKNEFQKITTEESLARYYLCGLFPCSSSSKSDNNLNIAELIPTLNSLFNLNLTSSAAAFDILSKIADAFSQPQKHFITSGIGTFYNSGNYQSPSTLMMELYKVSNGDPSSNSNITQLYSEIRSTNQLLDYDCGM